jgi:integrase
MPRVAKQLSELAVRKLFSQEGRHAVGGVAGLYLLVSAGSASWVLRMAINGRRVDLGLGSYRDVTLAMAREAAARIRLDARTSDPVEARRAEREARAEARAQARAQASAAVTFEAEARELHATKSKEFRNAKHAAQWLATLEQYAFPLIGHKAVSAIARTDVLDVLRPIWETKTETATRVRQRIEQVLDAATALNHRSGDNPARWRGGLNKLLPNPAKLRRRSRRHHPALPWQHVPAFIAALRKRGGMAARALHFAILCASRSGEVRGATWREIDLDTATWTIPANRMKAELAHTVTLSPPALDLLRALQKGAPDDLVFPAASGKQLSDMALTKVIRDMHEASTKAGGAGWLDPKSGRIATPHGTARSCFKDWARNQPGHVDELTELALAHVNSDSTRAAYSRDDLLPARRVLMSKWADYLASWATENVIPFPEACSA